MSSVLATTLISNEVARTTITLAAVALAVVAIVPYLRAMRAGRTKPHPVTWAVWAALTWIGFAAQVAEGVGFGAVVLGFSAAVCTGIAVAALKHRKQVWHRSDMLCVGGVVVAVGLWVVTSNPLTAVVIIVVIDALAFVPTVRKTWGQPESETLSNYTISAIKMGLSVIALAPLTLTAALYPLSLVVMNFMFVAAVMFRRQQMLAVATPVVVC